MFRLLDNLPNIGVSPLHYVFEKMKIKHKPDTLWLEFGVASGSTINYISHFTKDKVYGFDSFEGLPEEWNGLKTGHFSTNGVLPDVRKNVELIKGWFNETLLNFIKKHNKKISFIHIDCDLYSSTKYVLDTLKNYIDKDCIIVFDELVNQLSYEKSELKAFYEFINENKVDYEWIGMNGTPSGMQGSQHENAALIIKSIKPL